MTGGAFAFASQPRALKPRAKGGSVTETVEAPVAEGVPQNIMSDRRVVRGSTYGLYRREPAEGAGPESAASGALPPAPRRRKKGGAKPSIFDYKPPADTRAELDLSAHLIEPTHVAPTAHADTQTDGFAERPPELPYLPKKVGVDVATTMNFGIVESYEGEELDMPFNFNLEVNPLLEVLVGKTLEQAQLEVEQEAELEAIADAHEMLVAAQQAEANRVAGMERAAASQADASRARAAAERARAARERELARKVACVRCMAQVAPAVVEDAMGWFEARGTWVDPTVRQIRQGTLPWLMGEVDSRLEELRTGGSLVESVLERALEMQAAEAKAKRDEAEAAAAAIAKAKADAEAAALQAQMEREGWMRVYVNAASLGPEHAARGRLGPIKVDRVDNADQVQAKIAAFLAAEGIDLKLAEGENFAAMTYEKDAATAKIEEGQTAFDQGVKDETVLDILLPEKEEIAAEAEADAEEG